MKPGDSGGATILGRGVGAGKAVNIMIRCLALLVFAFLTFGRPVLAEQPLPKILEAIQIFLDRYSYAAPGRAITWTVEENAGPPGFRLVNAVIKSSDPAFSENRSLLITTDWKWIFDGHVLHLPESAAAGAFSVSSESLSRYLSQKTGGEMSVGWAKGDKPSSVRLATITQRTPLGPVTSGAAFSKDKRWFFFGAFFPLSADPRTERIEMLRLTGLPSEGPSRAPVTIVECSDFGCPACADLQPAIYAILKKHAGEIRIVHLDLPELAGHAWAFAAAERGLCVYKVSPGLYPSYRDLVFGMQQFLSDANVEAQLFATVMGLGVPVPLWKECGQKMWARDRILADLGAARTLGLNGTPVLFVNGVLLDRGIPSLLETEVEAALAGRKDMRTVPASQEPH